jgi:tyrosyl-DNA phosphodiesterase 2
MNNELANIRRERWLLSKAKETMEGPSVENTKCSGKRKNYIDLTLSDSDGESQVLGENSSGVSQKTSSSTVIQPQVLDNLKSFSICSYNIWFSEVHREERMAHVSHIISELRPKPTFVGMQEVTPDMFQILSPLLRSMGYVLIRQEGVAYGCAIGVLTNSPRMLNDSTAPVQAQVIDSGFLPYSMSQMGRGLLWVQADVETVGKVLFTTTHLESYVPGNDGSKERERQLHEACQFCLEKMKQSRHDSIKCSLITGDLNWDDERKRSSGTDRRLLSMVEHDQQDVTPWIDSWLETMPGQDGYTYDSRVNPMLKGNLRRRFDRCLACFRHDFNISIHSADLVGKDAIPGLQWRKEIQKWNNGRPMGEVSYDLRPVAPSDHFGLFVSFGPESKKPEEKDTQRKRRKRQIMLSSL